MKQKKELVLLAVLLVIAVAVWLFYFQQGKPVITADASSSIKNYQLLSVENPHIRVEKLEAPRKTEYKSLGRNIFSTVAPPSQAQRPQPIKPEPYGPKVPTPEPPPPPPALSVKFFGYSSVPNGSSRRAFFTDGEEIYIVPEGEVLMNRFRILKINNTNLEFEEISSGRRGTAQLEEQAGPPSA